MKRNHYILMLIALFVSMTASAQSIEKLTINGATYLLVSTEGMPVTSQWPMGYKMTDANGRTIRHQNHEGIGGNPNLNSRMSHRFIVAPYDTWTAESWSAGMGVAGTEDTKMQATSPVADRGCPKMNLGNRKWRMPTLRELELMWVFRSVLRQVYTTDLRDEQKGPMGQAKYWSATEADDTEAYAVDFTDSAPWAGAATKTESHLSRCVSDY